VFELQQNPELADYDMGTIEISIKKKIISSEAYRSLKSLLTLNSKLGTIELCANWVQIKNKAVTKIFCNVSIR
jgi:hypothetical protein